MVRRSTRQASPRGDVQRLRPKAHDRIADVLQAALELPLPLSPGARAELTGALSSYHPKPWPYVMLSLERGRDIQRQITAGERPGTTLGVWMAALSYAAHGTGMIEASREQLAELAGTTPQEASRALASLVRIDALIRVGRGRYALHPGAAWNGSLAARKQALEEVRPEPVAKPALRLVE